MNVLLIGGSGFVGHAVAELFLSRADTVYSLTRGNKPNPPGVESLVGDRSDLQSFAAAIKGRDYELVIDITAMNAEHVHAVLPPLQDRCGHYFLISTDFVYATDIETFPIDERAPKDTESPYAKGKLAAEKALEEYRIPTTALRPPHIIGKGKELGTGSVQGRDKGLLRFMRAGTGLTLIAEGEYLIAPVWTKQIALAIAACALKSTTFGQVMNCPGGDIVTTRQYYKLIADRLGIPLRYDTISGEEYRRDNPDKRAFARHRIYDTTKLRELAGYTPAPMLEDAIDETVAWMEENC